MGLTCKVEFNRLPEIKDKIIENAEKKITSATVTWHKCLVELLAGERSGQTYKVPFTKRTYTASAPGEPPAVRTGTLRSRYTWEVTKEDGKYTGIVGNPLEYAAALERGTSKMSPRPHLVPSFEKNKDKIIGEITKDWL